ncbi:thioredoxin-disulfide reductase [bacterium]|nr:thioredoxin-disulfide reductase [bacterium]
MSHHKLAIIGSGPAGLTSAIYASRARLEPVLFAGITFGGQLMNTTEVENFPGFPDGIMGPQLMQNMIKQAQKFGTDIKYEYVNAVTGLQSPFTITTDKGEYTADSIIVSTGSEPLKLGLDSEAAFWGKGVSSCATCDGAFYRDKIVAVIGGGDSAMEEATFLTKFASKVYIIHRRSEFRASKIMQERALANEKIKVLWNSEVTEVMGDQTVTGLQVLNNQTNEESQVSVDGMFLAIGYSPNTTFLGDLVKLRETGFIASREEVHTSVDGIFVAGDVEDHIYQQAITAAGAGCKAAIVAEKWLVERQ